jgi:hypothetical protein
MTDNFPITLQREDDEFMDKNEFLGVFSPPKTDYSVVDQWYERYTPLEPLERETKVYTFDIPSTATNIFTKANEIWYNIVFQLEKL